MVAGGDDEDEEEDEQGEAFDGGVLGGHGGFRFIRGGFILNIGPNGGLGKFESEVNFEQIDFWWRTSDFKGDGSLAEVQPSFVAGIDLGVESGSNFVLK